MRIKLQDCYKLKKSMNQGKPLHVRIKKEIRISRI